MTPADIVLLVLLCAAVAGVLIFRHRNQNSCCGSCSGCRHSGCQDSGKQNQ